MGQIPKIGKMLFIGAIFLSFPSGMHAQSINLRGKVTNAAGNPLSGAVVNLMKEGLKDTTGSDGTYSITKNVVSVLQPVIPQSEKIAMNNGTLELRLDHPSPVKVSVYNVKGMLLKKEVEKSVAAGIYRMNIAGELPLAGVLIINVSAGQQEMTFRYLPLQKVHGISSSVAERLNAAVRLAKITAVVDSLKITADGFSPRVVPLSNLDTTIDVILDSTGGACPHTVLKGSNILMIGDSWIELPGGHTSSDNQGIKLINLMKAAGVLGANEVADRRDVSGAPLSSIINQYNSKSNADVKILIMDGGGIDLFGSSHASQTKIDQIVKQFKDFLQKIKDEGHVEHIIYSLYPVIPTTPYLNDDMGPAFTEACENSPVDCHIVDLEPLFKGQHIGSDRTHADATGATIIAEAWWKAMQENCIGQ